MSEEQVDTTAPEPVENVDEVESGEPRLYFNATQGPLRMDGQGRELGGNEHGTYRYTKRIQSYIDNGWLVDKGEADKEDVGKIEAVGVSEPDLPGPGEQADAVGGPAPKAEDGVQRNRKRAGKTGSDESQEK